jgi:hypothetical protein
LSQRLRTGVRANAVVKKWAAFALAWSVRWRLSEGVRGRCDRGKRLTENSCFLGSSNARGVICWMRCGEDDIEREERLMVNPLRKVLGSREWAGTCARARGRARAGQLRKTDN